MKYIHTHIFPLFVFLGVKARARAALLAAAGAEVWSLNAFKFKKKVPLGYHDGFGELRILVRSAFVFSIFGKHAVAANCAP